MTSKRKLKAAIYTRVSTEHSLGDDFNSLQAQQEAGEAYIKSQKSEGWSLVEKNYEDAGISGGTLQRPALQELLKDIEGKKVDIIVVYKVDRLSRSLADFAQIIEKLDNSDASFVSVTQHFNTSNSMGRLTLNVLLSFAQFEREVTAERIRDKVDASKKKGIWMGGPIPLGYKSINKKLVIDGQEAQIIRTIFETYLLHPSVKGLKHTINTLQLKPSGTAAKPFTNSSLNYILKNEIYIGRIVHKGMSYKGEHKAIISTDLWENVQQKLKLGKMPRRSKKNSGYPSLLTGILWDDGGDKLSPSHTNKKGVRYRYYITKELYERKPVKRYSAPRMEKAIKDKLILFLTKGSSAYKEKNLQNLILAEVLTAGTPQEQQKAVMDMVTKVTISPAEINVHLKEPFNRIQHGLSMPLRLDNKCFHLSPNEKGPCFDEKLFALISNAHIWLNDLKSGKFKTIKELAQYHKVDKSDLGKNIRLAFLAPDIITAICKGTQPPTLKTTHLRRLKVLPANWNDQRRLLGF